MARAVVLDHVHLSALRSGKNYAHQVTRYYWDYYASLARQRAERSEEIRKSLLGAAEGPFPFAGWQRVVDYRYSLHPLSALGSVITDPGGRFNIGDIDRTQFAPFPALYLASDHSTAIRERFGEGDEKAGLSNTDFALRGGRSYSCVSVSGRLDAVIDLRHPERLGHLVEIIRKFKLPAALPGRAAALSLGPPTVARSVDELSRIVLADEWRNEPMQVDIPAGSQIFGQLTWSAGVEGIIYPSVRTGAICLAVFPQNLVPSSFVALDHQAPPGAVHQRLDSTTYRDFI